MSSIKEFLKKILSAEFFNVDQKLLNSTVLTNEMKKQWNETLQEEDQLESDTIWQAIISRIRENAVNPNPDRMRKYRIAKIYAAAATVLLLISIGIIAYLKQDQNTTIQYIVQSGNQQTKTIILDDGSKIKLGAGSTLSYPGKFTSNKRIVSLNGQAFFEVAKNKEKPFVVQMDRVAVTVLGTSFEVFNDENSNLFEAVLLSGKVQVDYMNDQLNMKNTYFLLPNQQITLSLLNGESRINQVNANAYSAWRNYEGLSFTGEKLSVIIPRLERWFGCKIICENKVISEQHFTFKVTDESFDQIVKLMSKTTPVSYKKESGKYVIF